MLYRLNAAIGTDGNLVLGDINQGTLSYKFKTCKRKRGKRKKGNAKREYFLRGKEIKSKL